MDDASTDATALIAAEFADAVVRLPDRPRGPAYARNRGVEVARGDIVVFVDADVCVHTDTLRRFTAVFANEPDVSAVFGAYDTQPEAPQLVSQYRNLLHHFVHSQSAGEAETFWAGCGAIRRDSVHRGRPVRRMVATPDRRSRTSSSGIASRALGTASCCARKSSARTSNAGRCEAS